MKYLIKLHKWGAWYTVETNFVVSEILLGLVSNTKGVYDVRSTRYSIDFQIAEMFDVEAVKKDISKIIDAYIQSNKNADKAEDKSLMEFAEQAEQYNFIRNYKK